MIDDVYQLALAALRRHLSQAGVSYSDDDGDLVIGDHRLGLSIIFDGFSRQGDQAIAPVEVQMRLDGDEGDRFRIGVLGVGPTHAAALKSAIDEWHLLCASPVLAALGAEAGTPRRGAGSLLLAGWKLFPGRAGLRGTAPPALQSGGAFFSTMLSALREEVSRWDEPREFALRSIFVMLSSESGQRQLQAAVDGFVSESLVERLEKLPWPETNEAYFYKQLLVLRHGQP